MNEYKFKAWHKLAHTIVEIDALLFMSGDYVAHAGTFSGSGPLTDIILMQWTGLKDKHGIEIYEDYIVKADWHWESPHVISWPVDCYDLIEYGLEADANLEVIGNKYEHGDLLEVTHD